MSADPTPPADLRALAALYDAAARHVDSVADRADVQLPYPLWHGWALREAFIAGAAFARAKRKAKRKSVAR